MKINSKNKLRIAMFSIHSDPMGKLGTQNTGGMSVYIREIATELGQAGHKIDIYTQANGNHRPREMKIAENIWQIHIRCCRNGPVPKEKLYNFIPQLFRSVNDYRKEKQQCYDLIHSHYWLSGILGNIAQKEWNIPHVITFHTTGMIKKFKCSGEQEPLLRLISEKKLATECNRILAPTERERDFFIKYYNIPSEKIGIVPGGVNLKQFQLIRKAEARERLGLSKMKFIILYVGRFVPIKGIDRLIASVSYLGQKDKLGLVIVGGDGAGSGSASALKRLTRKSGIDTVVSFVGRIDHKDLPLYYSASDILVIPSYYESFGLVALESLACGTPVIAPRVGAMENVIKHGMTGSILDKSTPMSLALAIERIRSSGNGFVSREEVRSSILNHSWANAAASALREYLKAAGKLSAGTDHMCFAN